MHSFKEGEAFRLISKLECHLFSRKQNEKKNPILIRWLIYFFLGSFDFESISELNKVKEATFHLSSSSSPRTFLHIYWWNCTVSLCNPLCYRICSSNRNKKHKRHTANYLAASRDFTVGHSNSQNWGTHIFVFMLLQSDRVCFSHTKHVTRVYFWFASCFIQTQFFFI